MKLTEALSGVTIAGAERIVEQSQVIIHRSRAGYHLSRYTNVTGNLHAEAWTFPNLFDLIQFAQAQGFKEIDADASDWRKVF